ncbi:MAG: YibE/F family protein [Eubacteriaceae bacterium]|nr:YibE/F family protein [Eubacteriaceae bacterium]
MLRRNLSILLIMMIVLCSLTATAAVFAESTDGTPPEDVGSSDETVPPAGENAPSSAPMGPKINYYKAEIVKVVTLTQKEDETLTTGEVVQQCMVEIVSGPFKNRVYQIDLISFESSVDFRLYEAGDTVMVACELDKNSEIKNIYIYDYYRVDKLIVLGIIAIAVVMVIGFAAGIRFAVSMVIFGLSYHYFFVPFMLKGYSPIILIIPICLVIIFLNIFYELGFTRSAVIALSGTFIAVLVASSMGLLAEHTAHLTGLGDSELSLLQYMPGHGAIDLSGLTFALAMLMSLGAAMSVSCTICTEMAEARELNQYISRIDLFRYGMHTGRNILSRSLLSLFFASLVSVVPAWIVYAGYSTPVYEILNLNQIASQFFKISAAVVGVALSVPFTSMLFAYTAKSRSLY